MQLRFQDATINEVAALVAIKQAVWPEESATVAQVKLGLSQPGQCTVLALLDDRPVGLAAGFPSIRKDGTRHWDLDLLAVAAAARGRQLGTRLIEQCRLGLSVPAGESMRALIATSNIASQIAFRRAGFALQQPVVHLYVKGLAAIDNRSPADVEGHLIPVHTHNYSGYWLESIETAAALKAAAKLPGRDDCQVVGALLAADRPDLVAAARAADYFHVGDYQWWLD